MTGLPNWTTPAERQPGWERGYAETLALHMAQPFAWGVSDCLIVPADLCAAMCGRNPMPATLRRYRSELGAAKLMRQLAFDTVEDALARVFPPIPVLRARRGDCGVLEQTVDGRRQLATLIVLGDGSAVGKGQGGIARVPVRALKSTFAIGSV